MKKRLVSVITAAVLSAALLAGCGGSSGASSSAPADQGSAAADSKELTKITIAASPTPHAEILEAAKPILAEKGYDLDIKVFDDYVQPNEVVNSGEIDAIGSLLVTLKSLRKVRVLPYHNYAGSKYRALGIDHALPDRLPTDTECTAAREHLRAMGIRIVE
jgi:ABC-type nitrate/sulfonate/bicarbonate transport system substrate-binding protein